VFPPTSKYVLVIDPVCLEVYKNNT